MPLRHFDYLPQNGYALLDRTAAPCPIQDFHLTVVMRLTQLKAGLDRIAAPAADPGCFGAQLAVSAAACTIRILDVALIAAHIAFLCRLAAPHAKSRRLTLFVERLAALTDTAAYLLFLLLGHAVPSH